MHPHVLTIFHTPIHQHTHRSTLQPIHASMLSRIQPPPTHHVRTHSHPPMHKHPPTLSPTFTQELGPQLVRPRLCHPAHPHHHPHRYDRSRHQKSKTKQLPNFYTHTTRCVVRCSHGVASGALLVRFNPRLGRRIAVS